jgi:hypothetical protein
MQNITVKDGNTAHAEPTMLGTYIDHEQNIIALVINGKKTIAVYQKTANNTMECITPQSPYILFNPYTNDFSAFMMDEPAHFYELKLKGSFDHYQPFPKTRLNINKVLDKDPNKSDIFDSLSQDKWPIPDNIPDDDKLLDLIFPPTPVNNPLEIPATSATRSNVIKNANDAIGSVVSSLPGEIKKVLQQEFLREVDYLRDDNALIEIRKLLGLALGDGDNLLRGRQLSENWLSFRFLTNPDFYDLCIGDLQSYLLNLFIALANNYCREDLSTIAHKRNISKITIKQFFTRGYRKESDSLELYDYTMKFSGLQSELQNQIEKFMDYPEGTQKKVLIDYLNERILCEIDPCVQVNDAILGEFYANYQSISSYWQVPVYVDFLASIWQICDAVSRFFIYIDIFTLRLSATGQMIAYYENLGTQLQEQINTHLNIGDNDFIAHVANQVWG